MTIDMTLMHLMCAKICHDLAAPASAVAMGLEMLSEAPQDVATRELVAYSAHSTIAKLELFRCLTGFSGIPTKPTGRDLENSLKNYWPDHKIQVVWEISGLETLEGPPARLLLAVLLAAADGLPRGGTLTVTSFPLRVRAEGPVAHLRKEVEQALGGQTFLSQQTANTIIAFFAHALAHNLGNKLSLHVTNDNHFDIKVNDI